MTSWLNCCLFLFSCYVAIEICFYFLFVYYLLPRANRILQPPVGYHDEKSKDRKAMLLRILSRVERTCRLQEHDDDVKQIMAAEIVRYLEGWFYRMSSSQPPLLTRANGKESGELLEEAEEESSTAASSSDNSSTGESSSLNDNNNDAPCLHKDEVADLIAWAFYGKHITDLSEQQSAFVEEAFDILRDQYNLVFPSGRGVHFKARQLTLEEVDAIHRPLLVYLLILGLRFLAGWLLRWKGFVRGVSSTGIVYWYRKGNAQSLPLLFFHGIAPAGVAFYLPMVLWGLIRSDDDRPVFLFENKSISSLIDFGALSEEETVTGVREALKKHDITGDIAVCGHSFGSCSISWLFEHAQLSRQIRQLVLLDPVTILLHEHDVMVNFMCSTDQLSNKIRMVASSELFTQYYLRRHFCWYRSDLWLEDVLAQNTKVLVCLAEQDEIVNASNVKQEIQSRKGVEWICWEDVGHAYCVTNSASWQQIREAMLAQELEIVKETKGQREHFKYSRFA